ncbi:MAG: transposase [Candidatus Syntrophopropionicum ammoniitolerans]
MSTKTALFLLLAYPTPTQLLDAPAKDVIALIRSISRQGQNYAENKYKALKQCAKDTFTFGIQLDGRFTCIEIYATILQEVNKQLAELETQIVAYAVDVPAVELLATIPGVVPKISTTLAGEIGDIDRFSNAKQLVAFLGIDPSVRQSGKFVGTKNRLTKRASPLPAGHYIWLQWCPSAEAKKANSRTR